MEEELVKLLIKLNYHISTAESLTGGLIASKIVSISGASNILNKAYITYSNEAKESILNVKKESIEKYNVVSSVVAKEMVEGLYNITNAEVLISTTGVAGPGSSDGIPEGTAYVGIKIKDNINIFKLELGPLGRNKVRDEVANFAINKTYELLMKA